MKIYMIYKKSLYNELSWFEKILYIIGGGSKKDTLVAFTTNGSLAKTYIDINCDNDLYVLCVYMPKSEYDEFSIINGDLLIKSYDNSCGEFIIINEKNKFKLIEKGVLFYDNIK